MDGSRDAEDFSAAVLPRADYASLGRGLPQPGVEKVGVEAAADWQHLRTPETYLGGDRGERRHDGPPEHLRTGHWTLTGDWTIGRECVTVEQGGGSIAFRFRARDAHAVLSLGGRDPVAFRVRLDGEAPGPDHGLDVDADGNGTLCGGRLYQLVRQEGPVRKRTVEVSFAAPGAQAYAFTFG